MFIDKILTAIFGSQNDRDLKALKPILAKVNAKEEWAKSLPAEEFPKQTERFKEELKQGKIVLTSAALTYVASIATTLIQVLKFIIMYGRKEK